MTQNMKEMLASIADGSDPNLLASLSRAAGKKEENKVAKTMMALFRNGLLQIAKGGGLEISDKGRAAAEKIKRAKP